MIRRPWAAVESFALGAMAVMATYPFATEHSRQTAALPGGGSYVFVDLSGFANDPIDWLVCPPAGQVTFDGVPFVLLSGERAAVKSATARRPTLPTAFSFPVPANQQIARVHVMLSGTWVDQEPGNIAVLRIVYRSGPGTFVDLARGRTIQEGWLTQRDLSKNTPPEPVPGVTWRTVFTEPQKRGADEALAFLDVLTVTTDAARPIASIDIVRVSRVAGFAVTAITLELKGASAQPRDDGPSRAKQELEAARRRWRANAVPYYRLRVSTFNPLYRSVVESDVREGGVVAARQTGGIPGFGASRGTADWGPSEGHTVESLFDMIDRQLSRTCFSGIQVEARTVSAAYDSRHGYPTRVFSAPVSAQVMDADVLITIELVVSPPEPLVAPSPGEAYATLQPARIVDPLGGYSTLFGFGSSEVERTVRGVWPDRADEIVRRGVAPYWRTVGWAPRVGLVGNIIGTIRHPSGSSIYVMEFRHDGGTVFYLIEKASVEIIK